MFPIIPTKELSGDIPISGACEAAKVHAETMRKINEDACNPETAADCANAVNKQIKFKIGDPLPGYEPSPEFEKTFQEGLSSIRKYTTEAVEEFSKRLICNLKNARAAGVSDKEIIDNILGAAEKVENKLKHIDPISGKDGFCSMTLATKGNQYATQVEIISKRLNELIESHNKIVSIIQK